MTPVLLSVPEAAARLTLKPKTLANWISQRRIEHVRIGNRVRIPERVVAELIQKGTVKPVTVWKGGA